jgi:antibiotic biosynthesis monooxygenase (ABM) superfamily enzyme
VIARIWHGWTTQDDADAYQQLLLTEVLPGIAAKQIPGYVGPHVLREDRGDEVEFITIMWFDSIENVKAFQGEDYAKAYIPESARAVLSRWDDRSDHYDVLLTP